MKTIYLIQNLEEDMLAFAVLTEEEAISHCTKHHEYSWTTLPIYNLNVGIVNEANPVCEDEYNPYLLSGEELTKTEELRKKH